MRAGKILAIFIALWLTTLTAAAEKNTEKIEAPAAVASKSTLLVGTTSGADVEILEHVRDLAANEGLTLKIVEFSDYVRPNFALAQKEIDVNAFQHLPYLQEFCADRGLNLVAVGNTYVSPMGFYSKKIQKIDDVHPNDAVAIPNDPTNGGRALLLLQRAGLIEIRDGAGLTATIHDVIKNDRKLRLIEVEAAQTPRALDDVTIAAINNTFAIPAGLNPLTDAIYLEDTNSPYVNVIAARPDNADDPRVQKFVEIYQSPAIAKFILNRFKGSTIPAFEYDSKTTPNP